MNICIIGAGNVGSHLARALFAAGHNITTVHNRTAEKGRALAAEIEAEACSDFGQIPKNSDAYIIAVKDDAIDEAASKLQINPDGIVMHTAGSVSLNVLTQYFKRTGVLYPLQTFSKGRKVDVKKIPFFIEANNEKVFSKIKALALSMAGSVTPMDSTGRKKMHLAAVFACNYSNYMYSIASDILNEDNIPLDIMKPLLRETLEKAIALGPKNSQSGPALRNDTKTLEAHADMLKNTPNLQKLYTFVSSSINEYFSNK